MTHRLPILADFLFLHNLLSEKAIDHQSFEAISSHIQKKFNRNDFLTVGTLLSLLIKNNDLPETTNRLVAYYILYDMFRNDEQDSSSKESPFQYFLFSLIDSKDSIYKLNTVERNFIVQLLASGTKDVSQALNRITTNDNCSNFSFRNKHRITSSKPNKCRPRTLICPRYESSAWRRNANFQRAPKAT